MTHNSYLTKMLQPPFYMEIAHILSNPVSILAINSFLGSDKIQQSD